VRARLSNMPELEGLGNRLKGFFSQRPEVIAAYLFGSQVRERATQHSDVDIAVLLESGFDLQERPLYRIEQIVELELLARCPVDLVLLNQASLVLCNQVLKYGRLLYEADHRQRVTFEVQSRQAYYDFKPTLALLRQALTRQIGEVGLGRRYRGHRDPLGDARRARERFESLAASHV
jgi:predicted nucleotidyltransferase